MRVGQGSIEFKHRQSLFQTALSELVYWSTQILTIVVFVGLGGIFMYAFLAWAGLL